MINIDADAIFSVKSFIIYLIAINIITFLVRGLDKWKAKHGSWRIQEATLFTLVLFVIETDGSAVFSLFLVAER